MDGASIRSERGARRRAWGVALAASVLALLHAWSFRGTGPVDDDYILYRYAANLVGGKGLVFNAGERVEGFTAPLYVLVLALGTAVGLAPRLLSLALCYLAAGGAAWCVARLEHARGRRAPLAAWLVAASPAIAYHANVGMGTTLLAVLLCGAHLAHRCAELRGRAPRAAGVMYGLAALLRAEAVLFALPFALCELRRKRRAGAVLALAPIAAWTLFRLAYYGRIVPVTYAVKKLPFFVDLEYGAEYLLESTLSSGVLVLALLAGVFAWRARASLSAAQAVALLGLVLHTAYVVYVGGDYMRLGRFFVPTLPLLFYYGVQGARELVPALRKPPVAAAVVILACVALQWPQLERGAMRAVYEQNEERWIRIGVALRRTAPPGTSVALAPIGAIGFHSRLPIVDTVGLTNEAILRAEPDLSDPLKGHHRHDAAWVLAQEPDVVLLGNGVFLPGTQTIPTYTGDQLILARPEFAELYDSMAMPIEGSYPLVFFLRRGSEPPAGARPVQRR